VTLVDADVSSAPEPTYQISGQDVEAIGKVREGGVPLDSGLPAYTLLEGARQIQIHHEPEAEITLDAARTGPGYIPPAPVDALDGEGSPFQGDEGTGDIDDFIRVKVDASIPDTRPYYIGGGMVEFPQNANSPRSYIESTTQQLIAGTRYRYRMVVHQIPPSDGVQPTICLTYNDGMFQAYASMNSEQFYAGNPDGDPRVLIGTFECAFTHLVRVFYEGNAMLVAPDCRISDLTFIELPPLDDTGDDVAVEDALPKLLLEDAMRMIIEGHAGLPSSVWSASDAEAIDVETGYAGGGTYFEEQATRRDALERFMTGYSAGIYKGRDGTLRVARMRLPELEIGSDPILIDGSEFLRDLVVRRDPGLGLTRQIGVRRNFRLLTDADVDTAALNPAQRARLAREYRYVLSTGASFAAGNEHVDAADPWGTHLWMPGDGQAEADYAGAAGSLGRAWYETRMPFRADIDVMTVALLTYDRYGMQAGVPVVCIPVVEDRINGVFETILFWGPAPFEEF
jgi:hypothetical protein